MKTKIRHIYDPIFRQNYYYVQAKTHKEFEAIMKKQMNADIGARNMTIGRTCEFLAADQSMIAMWTVSKKPDIVAHEVFHAVHMSLDRKGLKLSDDSDEAYAYLAQFLTKQIFS